MKDYFLISCFVSVALANCFIYAITPYEFSKMIYYYSIISINYILGSNIIVHGDVSIFKKGGYLIMSNHYEGLDYLNIASVIFDYRYNDIYTIAKSDLLGDNVNKTIVEKIKENYFNASHFISYIRGNKDSGIEVKNEINNILKYKKNVNLLVFPEGRSWRKGKCVEFKSGMFKYASENNIEIIPITINYRNFEGKNKGEKCILTDWLYNTCDIYVHDVVKVDTWNIMLDNTFKKISSKTDK